jgi:integrase
MLLAAASPEHLLVLVCLLCGIGPEEIGALRVEHLHTDAEGAHSLHIPGESPRVLPLVEPLAGLGAAVDPAAQALPLIPAANGQPLKTDDIAAAVTSSAFDAGLDQPQSITPESLRHTYVAFLVRQGLKFGEMNRVVGKLSPDMLNALAPLAPHGERRPISDIERMMPAVRALSDPDSA